MMNLLIGGISVVGFISLSAMFLIWLERKISAHIQNRMGPMICGWHGSLQSIADSLKLLLKENIVPSGADKLVWSLAPFFVTVPVVMAFLTVPFSKTLIVRDLNVGILYVASITSICVLGIFMAGWGSNNKYSLLGGMRSAAQIISYEVPLLLSIVLVVMEAGTLSMQGIVQAQEQGWYVLKPNLAFAFLIYLISSTAEVNRVPFDIPEAESELGAGYHTEYTGMKFAMFFVAEYTNLVVVSAIATTLFLGGWQGPLLPGLFWFLIKVYGLVCLSMWVRWTLPRVRMDQMMTFAWKVLTPLSILNLLVSGWWMVR
ncbi:MAG: NADH-quinone oxidoreductase subunit H [Omnitrophica WOR_2 bacterium RIFCSPHIGHO2_01_FULL_48_9]|nr:MAG: NADH-quinone oxidoreductase subunit H [Omnitrophica WOR_2 bacterium RIFCSPHIGHO2_02_FULL_48_11]OGX32364.1 MAG: NADH-quinone oxidoreductase subunit H [Omnitrophica WOR_2 bacterium RIFCSPHIGHO2_01_FULL_48_9]